MQVARMAKVKNQRIETGTPSTVGSPDGKRSIQPAAASEANVSLNAMPVNRDCAKPVPAASARPRIWVEPPVAIFSPTRDRPRRMNRDANVTINDGRRVLITIWPLNTPTAAATSSVTAIARRKGICRIDRATPKVRPAKATIEPIDRSNSPPIISRAAPMAKMPNSAAGTMIVMTPFSVNIDRLAVAKKKMATRMSPAIAPSSGRRMIRVTNDVDFSRSSATRNGFSTASLIVRRLS